MIDPKWAWATFQPSAESPWDLRAAAHLYRRAGFAANRSELDAAANRDPHSVIDDLLNVQQEPKPFRDQMRTLVRAALATGNVKQLSAQWVYRMLNSPVPLLEKTTLFWHGHFATSAAKVDDADLMQVQNELLRQNAVGDFANLLLEIARDPAMLLYLDSASNRKSHPNENFAREIMELFCLGEGNYSEQDVRELARCFTGWEIKRKKFRFNQYQHDNGEKSLLGVTGKLGGEQGVAAVAAHKSGPEFIVGKLIRYFVMDEPKADDGLVKPLAKELRENDFHIGPTIKRLLGSNLFFSSKSRGRKVRSPVELGVGFLKALDGSTDAYQLADSFQELGQGLYYPPSVKGWDGGRTWINSSTLLGRANLIRRILDSGKTRFGRKSLTAYLSDHGINDIVELADFLEPLLFATPIPAAAKQRLARMDAGEKDQQMKDAVHILCSIAEFQLA